MAAVISHTSLGFLHPVQVLLFDQLPVLEPASIRHVMRLETRMGQIPIVVVKDVESRRIREKGAR
jgi:hypothetical protein